ncbi:TRAP transporter substrate-binding protein [Methylobacterium longum]|uniref:TRAP transporter substrate-binding protein n=1 Tax=Methylobacterium longum TaxID=767694 RepID=A0ABT8ALN7_9HYPH|nr:TRAP transporter substrate-binding protein [Methylobacterium longum]MDN3570804.1 TRAP transporter substrate-binding protein [Methylobacterium longum]GJE13513.1 C4-dicarboxylate-binding periplasmic protein DctP [Methylobacterium longum]
MRIPFLGPLACALALATALATPAAAQAPIVIKFSHVTTTDTPKGQGAERFKQLAEARTNGAVKVEIYPNSTLYKDKEEVEMLQLGAVQMLAPSTSKFGPLGVKEYEAFDLPYIFPNEQVLRRVQDGPIGQGLFNKLESKGITGLGYWDNGFKILTSNKPMHAPEDMRGLKFRIQSSKVLEAQFKQLGALPQVLAFSELYQALQTGVVDGQENPPSNVTTQKLNEVQKHATLTHHGYVGYAVIVNKGFWDGLPAGIRTTLEGAMTEATAYEHEIADKQNAQALADIRATGKTAVYTPTEAENAAWRKALAPVQREMASRVGKDLIAALNKEAGAAGAAPNN